MRSRAFLGLLLLIQLSILVTLVGCNGTAEPSRTTSPPRVTGPGGGNLPDIRRPADSQPPLGALSVSPKSALHGVPVPETARIRQDLSSEGWSEMYLESATSYNSLSSWYERHLPSGQSFGAWAWCSRDSSPLEIGEERTPVMDRYYYRASTGEMLNVGFSGPVSAFGGALMISISTLPVGDPTMTAVARQRNCPAR